MHELSVATAVLGTALKHADGRRVTVVSVRVGRLRQVVPDSLRFYFEIVARDSDCEQATLELVEIPARLRCRACQREWSPELPAFRCPDCGSTDVSVDAGQELEVDYIEVEDKELACTAPR
ncbi:MAG: hydrogenase maturation nickel metallochaperone HypA [Solirubrobacteraceae bacterium]